MTDNLDKLLIDTPENVVLDAEIAGFGTRCVAALLDYLILIAVLLIALLLYSRASKGSLSSTWSTAGLTLFQFVLLTFYHLFSNCCGMDRRPANARCVFA